MVDRERMIQVKGRDGIMGWMDPKEQSEDQTEYFIRLTNGQAILVPQNLLARQDDGSYYLPMSRDQFMPDAGTTADQEEAGRETLMVIPVVVEKATVGTERTTRRVRVTKRVTQREELIQSPGFREEVQVERIPVNQIVEVAPEIRLEGDTTIIPILEEELVVQKRLRVKEEVRITLKQIPNSPQTITLRAEELDVERLEGKPGKEASVQSYQK